MSLLLTEDQQLLKQSAAEFVKNEQVLIRFKDGSEQLVKLNTRLDRFNPIIDISLDRSKKIHGFVLYGSSSQGSAYQILAL